MGLAASDHQAETRWLATLAEVRRQAARVAEAAGVQVRPREHIHYLSGWDIALSEPARVRQWGGACQRRLFPKTSSLRAVL